MKKVILFLSATLFALTAQAADTNCGTDNPESRILSFKAAMS